MITGCSSALAGYGALASRLRMKAARARTPLEGSIELTARCNLACRHCYINQPEVVDDIGAAELDTDTIRQLFDQLADAGCLWLGITGGEPLLRPDFAELYRSARQRGFLITLLTNGTLIDESIADLLQQLPPLVVEITLYGHSAQTVDRVTGRPGSLARCHEGIELLADRGVNYRLKTTLTNDNRHELDEMRAFAAERCVDFRLDGLLNARLDGAPLPDGIALAPADLVALELSAPETRAAWDARRAEQASGPESRYQCSAGVTAFHMDFRGRLMPCLMARRPAYSLLDGDFRAGWDGPILEAIEGWARAESGCRDCAWASCCDVCPGWGLIEHGDATRPVDHLCRVAEQRARELGVVPRAGSSVA